MKKVALPGGPSFAAIAAAFLFLAVPAWGQQRRALPTHLSAPANIRAIDRLPGSQRLSLSLTLQLRNQEDLKGFLHDLYDPTSPNYRHYLTVEQFTERFGPTQSDYDKVANFASSNGLAVTRVAPNRLVLNVSGAVSDVERAFQVTMHVYQHPTERRTFYAPDAEPSLDASLPVQGVGGLSNFSPPRRASQGVTPQATSGPGGSGPSGSFLGSDIRAAYFPGVTLDGSGQAVGLFEEGPYNLSDIQLYFSSIKQPLNVPIVNVLLDGAEGICSPGCPQSLEEEAALDIEQAISIAPNLSAVFVYEGVADVDILNQMAVDDVAKQLSISYVWYPDPSSAEPIFQEFAAQGQSVLASSGDGGAFTSPSCTSNCFGALFPAADPYVTAVGGTTLVTTGPGGAWESETTSMSSGGGVTSFPIPSYQVPAINSQSQGSTTLRNVPDLAASSYAYSCFSGICATSGGTSISAPRWAAFAALANQQANGALAGFLNPTIYAIASGPNYANDFHDITVGNNFNSFSPNLFQAVPGYDLVTGLGSPNGAALLSAIAPPASGPNFTLSASPGTANVTPGGQTIITVTVQPVNGFNGTVSLRATAAGQLSGITAGFNPSSISGSGTSTLTITAADTPLNASIPIVVSGASGTLTHSASTTLAVLVPNLIETAVSAPPVPLNTGASFSVTDTAQNLGNAPAAGSVMGYYLSATTSKTVDSHLLGTRSVPALAASASSTATTSLTVPPGLWPNTAYYLLACANDTGVVVQANTSTCDASTSTATVTQAALPPTTTTLAMSSGGGSVTSVAQGAVITLTATVMSGSAKLTTGRVNFCDANATYCTDIHLLGTGQLTQAGTAALKFIPGIGSHSYKAVFAGTVADAGSSSSASTLTVTGKYSTATTIAQSGSSGNYTLTAMVSGADAVSPSGQVSFIDASNGNNLVGSASLSVGTPTPSWSNSQTPATAPNPRSFVSADFNGDGIPDLAVVDYPSGEGIIGNVSNCTILVLLGNGDGTFRAAPRPAVGCFPLFLATGDFNGDGKIDLAVTNYYNNTVMILLGNGDGTFAPAPANPATGTYPNFVAVGDFNGDGIADLAVENEPGYNASSLTILLGNGDGTFIAAASPATQYVPEYLATGDFNGDGKLDIAVANQASGTVTILLGNGDGTFTQGSGTYSINTPTGIAVGDFNGDGKADLAVTSSNNAAVTILLGKGDGTFTASAASPSTGAGPSPLTIGDFNGDGKTDLAVPNTISNTVTVLLGKGDGTFAPATANPVTGTEPLLIAAADFNGDGKSDLTVLNLGSSSVTVLLNMFTTTATASAGGISPVGSGTHQVEASFPGDSNFTSSVSGTVALVVNPKPSATSLTSSLNPEIAGQSVTLTATVTSTAGGTPTGAVTFYNGSTALGTGPVTLNGSGVATLATTAFPVGSDSITASYSGDSNYAATTSPAVTETVNAAGFAPAPTGLTVTAGQNLVTNLTLYAAAGFGLNFTLSCVGLPSKATCQFVSNPVAPGPPPSGTTVQLTFGTSSSRLPSGPSNRGPWRWVMPGIFAALAALLAAAMILLRRNPRLRLAFGMCVAIFALASVLIGCGSSGGNSSSIPAYTGTPKGAATFTVMGVSGTTTISIPVSVTVQ